MHSSKGTKLKLYTPHGAIEYPISILWRCQPVSSVVGTVFFKKKLGAAGACTMLFATYIN